MLLIETSCLSVTISTIIITIQNLDFIEFLQIDTAITSTLAITNYISR